MVRFLKFIAWVWVVIICCAGLAFTAVGIFLLTTPRPTALKKGCLTTEMYRLHLCPTDASYVKLHDISIDARNAVVVSEDAAFYGHHGFDWDEMRTSMKKNIDEGKFARGGSTITQQLAKNVYLTKDKSILRKIREALITVQIEDLLTKDEILEKYLNVVEFAPNVYGIGAASKYYFQKPPAQLSAAEGAWLAFLLPNPKKLSVSFRRKSLTPFAERQVREIIDRLQRFRKIQDDEHDQAINEMAALFGPPVDKPEDGVSPEEESAGEDGGD